LTEDDRLRKEVRVHIRSRFALMLAAVAGIAALAATNTWGT
jgi:hypothetical protein